MLPLVPVRRIIRNKSMVKKRKFSRFSIDFPITCTFIDNQTKIVLTSPGKVLDISTGGMRITVPIPKPMVNSSKLSYSLTLPEPFSTITGQGHIKWSDRDNDKNIIIFGMSFDIIRPEDRKMILEIIEELQE